MLTENEAQLGSNVIVEAFVMDTAMQQQYEATGISFDRTALSV